MVHGRINSKRRGGRAKSSLQKYTEKEREWKAETRRWRKEREREKEGR